MADLVPTIIDDDAAEEEEADDGGFVLAKKGGLLFNDLVSDEEDGPAGWDFDGHETTGPEGVDEPLGGLQAKIRDRLLEKAEEQGEETEKGGDDTTDSLQPMAKATSSKQGLKRKAADLQGTVGHLRTDVHFADLRLSRPLLRAVGDAHFDTPTPIQRDVIPPALQGLDVLATAETGSGKTASFLLPILERLCQSSNVRARRRDSSGRVIMGHVATKAMVLIPTRELAVQCHAMLKDLSKYTLVTYQLVAGGFVAKDQALSLRQQPDIVIATPGRLLDHLLNSQSVHMELLEIVVFDEADRLLELGFREECLQVLKRCSRGRQTMLFSATMNTSVQDLAALALVKPVRVHANPVNRVAETLEQEFVKAPGETFREAVLLSLCTRNYTARVIVFCATRQAAHRLAIIFGLCGLRFTEIHGNLAQAERVEGLQRFQRREADFLLATDLAARGLDLDQVETVINFHLPLDSSRYIHRVGRTARKGQTGRAVTIYCPEEYVKVKKLGRQCCSKVKSKVMKRTISSEAVQKWLEKINGLQEDIELIQQEESLERETRLADLLVSKSDNLQKYKKEIQSRPAKSWYMTNREKQDLKAEEVEHLEKQQSAEAEEEEAASSKKRNRERDRQEIAEEKRKKRAREKAKKQKEQARAERARVEAKMRASARRVKKSNKPGKIHADVPEKSAGAKKKKKGGKRR